MTWQGSEIRRIANKIERLDPTVGPVFTGIEVTGGRGEQPRGLFQDGVVLGLDASLAHAHKLLSDTVARLSRQAQVDGTIAYPAEDIRVGWVVRIDSVDHRVVHRTQVPSKRVRLHFDDGTQFPTDRRSPISRVIDWDEYK